MFSSIDKGSDYGVTIAPHVHPARLSNQSSDRYQPQKFNDLNKRNVKIERKIPNYNPPRDQPRLFEDTGGPSSSTAII